MAIAHASPGEAIDVRPLCSPLPSEKIVALFKSEQLEVIRLVLTAGKSLPPHKVPGGITVLCIEGSIDVTTEGKSHVLGAVELLYLSGGMTHGVMALEDASALVTIALVR